MKFFTKFLFLFLIIPLFSYTQNVPPQRTCAFDPILEKTIQENPGYLQQLEQINSRILQTKKQLQQQRGTQKDGIIYTIPVVVHIIHNNGAENISDAQVQSQITVLNEDFRKITGSRGDGAGVDTEIEFCLATIDPNGNPTTGITRTVSTLTDHDYGSEEASLKGLIQWDPNSYLNIWVVQRICNGGSCGILGYARFPGGDPTLDGVVNGYNYFGSKDHDDGTFVLSAPYDLGRTATHEVGHWLSLYHTFQGGCTNNDCTVDGDRVCDTPPVKDPNYNCPTGTNSCSTDPNSGFASDVNDYIDDYMDYSDDACMSRLTQGQTDRMSAAIINYRSNLSSSTNLDATGCNPDRPPVAKFTADPIVACEGQTIQFTDQSSYSPTSWSWDFGDATTSTVQHPTHSYAAAGTYTVTLTASNSFGTDDTVMTNYITVQAANAIPLTEGFEDAAFPPADWILTNSDNGKTFERNTSYSGDGASTASTYINNYSYTTTGEKDLLISPLLDFGGYTNTYMTFKHAYAWYYKNNFPMGTTQRWDSLNVYISTDCGATYTKLYSKGKNELETAPELSTEYFPANTEWVKDSIDLTAYDGLSGIRIKFEAVNGNGNNLFLDDINIDGTGSPLPIKVYDFTAIPLSGSSALLKWKSPTAPAAGYILERSTSLNNGFVEITTLTGPSFEQNTFSYEYIDSDLSNSYYYYRIKQDEGNDSFSYSKIVAVELDKDDFIKRIYPVPAQDELHLVFANDTAEKEQVKLTFYNAVGEVVSSWVIPASSGQIEEKRISLEGLGQGFYILEIAKGKKRAYKKIMIAR